MRPLAKNRVSETAASAFWVFAFLASMALISITVWGLLGFLLQL